MIIHIKKKSELNISFIELLRVLISNIGAFRICFPSFFVFAVSLFFGAFKNDFVLGKFQVYPAIFGSIIMLLYSSCKLILNSLSSWNNSFEVDLNKKVLKLNNNQYQITDIKRFNKITWIKYNKKFFIWTVC